MKSPLRVLQVVDTLGMGGAETWLMELLRYWSKSGEVEVDFLLTSGKAGVFDDEARRLGAQLHYNRYGRDRLGAFTLEFRRLLARRGYDAVHDHSDFASGWRYLLGVGHLPSVRVTHVHNPTYQIRNNNGTTLSRRLAAKIGQQLVARLATYIAGTSAQVLREYGFETPQFRRVQKGPIYCGFDPSRFAQDDNAQRVICEEFGWPLTAKLILFVGRIDQSPDLGASQNHKNSGFAVDCVIQAARQDENLCAIFAGAPSPASPILESRIAQAGLQRRVRLVGIRSDIDTLMKGCNMLLFPSRAEGLGMVAVEAQAAGLPVLASTGVPEECVVVRSLVHFKAVDAGLQAWAQTITSLASQPKSVDAANRAVSLSPFAVEASALRLRQIYSGASAS